jgi:hypothetical protein
MVSQPVMLNGDSFSMCFWANLGEFGTRIQPLFVSPLLLLGRLSTRERVCARARACNTCVPCVRAMHAARAMHACVRYRRANSILVFLLALA